ncbi:hypothetical protein CPB97_008767 [Podila verticillata]|nr:hypothetical protein CPB97_008767 [Podila verticillata]
MANPNHPPPKAPPVLSFRTFHAAHFSATARQAFFGGSVQHQHQPGWQMGPSGEYPTQDDTYSYYPTDQYSQSTPVTVEESISSRQEHQEAPAFAGAGGQEGLLSEETIAIFEFSRRFRQEKAEAARLEEAEIKKRRTKRRKLTRLGFAYNEGDSGEDDSSFGDTDAKDEGLSRKNTREQVDQEADDDDDDDGPTGEELPATDVTFMAQNDRLRNKTWQRLYGTTNEKEAISNKPSTRFASIDMLESLLNQQYENSLITDDGTSGKRQRHRASDQQVVYWPGMPLRC